MNKVIKFLKDSILVNNSYIDFLKKEDSEYSVIWNSRVIGNCKINKDVKITLDGNLESLKVTCGDVTVNGNVTNKVSTVNGDIEVKGSVAGNISTTNGDINVLNK